VQTATLYFYVLLSPSSSAVFFVDVGHTKIASEPRFEIRPGQLIPVHPHFTSLPIGFCQYPLASTSLVVDRCATK
jgi:hypothetical protein